MGRLAAALSLLVVAVPAGTALAASAPAGEGALATPLRDLDGRKRPGAFADRQGFEVKGGERVLVDVHLNRRSRVGAAKLRKLGMEVEARTDRAPLPVLEGWLPIDALEDAAALGVTRAIVPVVAGGVDAGAIQSEGDAAHKGPQARSLFADSATAGEGVHVGIISDSINAGGGLAAAELAGELPSGVNVITDHAAQSDEGRAMAEIVYDTAHGITEMSFASGTATGSVGKAAAINSLVAAGAKIIADDIFYLSEPFFQDGAVSQAVDAAKAAGVTYFASAGNRARQSWEGTYTNASGFHDFGGGDTTQEIVSVPDGAFIQLVLQWDEAWGDAVTDIDAFLVDTGNADAQLDASIDDNIATGLPGETLYWENDTAAAVSVGVRIERYDPTGSSTSTPFMKYIARGDFGTFTVAEHDTSSDTINPDAAAAAGSLAVAAVAYNDVGNDTPELFSSRGPTTRLFDKDGVPLGAPLVRPKPELAAADGVSTSTPGFGTFFGTSAATPSAAGVAALVLSMDRTLNVDVVRAIMTDPANAVDCTSSALSPDPDCGAGFVFADSAVLQALDASPPNLSSTVTPAAPNGQNGFYTGDVQVSFTFDDPQSPAVGDAGCQPPSVTSDTAGTTITCNASSGGGTTSKSVTVKRDATPPAAVSFTGIAAQAYTPATLPAQSAVSCTAADPTAGLASCSVSGYATSLGLHTLTATATDNAGNVGTSTLTYSVVDGTPPVIAAAVLPASPDGLGGFYTSDVDVSWALVDPETAVTTSSGCEPQTLSTDRRSTTFACSATSAGGTSSESITLKRDSSAPTRVRFRRIEAGTYSRATLPRRGSISCRGRDRVSRMAGCEVTGYSRGRGRHRLVASASNRAGLTAERRLRYRVGPALSVGLLERRARGDADLTVNVPGRGRVAVKARQLRGASTRTRRAGRPTLRLRPRRSARARLARGKAVRTQARVTFTPRKGTARVLTRRLRLRRTDL